MNFKEYMESEIEIKEDLLRYFSVDKKINIFDIGSCEGEDSIKYSLLFPNSNVYSFEPLKSNFEKVQKNVSNYGLKNIHMFNEALSNNIGEADFYVSSGHPDHLKNDENWNYGNKSSSLLAPHEMDTYYKWLSFKEKETVKTNTLSNFCEKNQIDQIHFAHIDVQGAELMVLEGASNFIDRINMIWLEAELVELYKSQPLKDSVVNFLKSKGFVVIKDTCAGLSGDILCINKKLMKEWLMSN